jgi:antitoxin (DNA-binding transcriptional repressor) of toxin-antitoxin stability system
MRRLHLRTVARQISVLTKDHRRIDGGYSSRYGTTAIEEDRLVPLIESDALISISEAAELGVSTLVREAEAGHERVVLRDNRPVAAVVSMARLEQIQALEEDLLDLVLAAARMLTAEPERHRLDEVLAQFGYTRAQLRDVPD